MDGRDQHRRSDRVRSAPAAPRVTIYSVDEFSSGIDPVLGKIFATMRGTVGLPIDEIAWRLRTAPEILSGLEAGRIRILPSPAEATRVVQAYGRLAGVDVQPILSRLIPQISEDRLPLVRRNPPAVFRDG